MAFRRIGAFLNMTRKKKYFSTKEQSDNVVISIKNAIFNYYHKKDDESIRILEEILKDKKMSEEEDLKRVPLLDLEEEE